jgi:hypothetical protein
MAQYVSEFYELCQKNQLQVTLDETEPETHQYAARMTLRNISFCDREEAAVDVAGVRTHVRGGGIVSFFTMVPSSSKKEAKGRAAKAGVDFLRDRLARRPRAEALTSILIEVPLAPGDQNERWLGVLNGKQLIFVHRCI